MSDTCEGLIREHAGRLDRAKIRWVGIGRHSTCTTLEIATPSHDPLSIAMPTDDGSEIWSAVIASGVLGEPLPVEPIFRPDVAIMRARILGTMEHIRIGRISSAKIEQIGDDEVALVFEASIGPARDTARFSIIGPFDADDLDLWAAFATVYDDEGYFTPEGLKSIPCSNKPASMTTLEYLRRLA